LISTLYHNFSCCIFQKKNDKHVFLVIVVLKGKGKKKYLYSAISADTTLTKRSDMDQQFYL